MLVQGSRRVPRRLGISIFVGGLLTAIAAPVAAEQVTIVLDARGGATTGKWSSWETLYKRLIEKFEAEHPNINVEYRSDWDTQKITVEMAAGTAPDIFEFWGAFGYAWAQNGSLLDLNPYLKRDFMQKDIDNFYPPQWDAGIVRFGRHSGERYGVPKYSNASVLYYNQDILANAGLPFPTDEDARGNWNYNTFLAFAKKLTLIQPDGRTTQYGMTQCLGCDGRYATYVWGFGGKVFDLPENPTQYMLNQPAGIEALEYIAELNRAGVWGGNFVQGTAAMLSDGTQGIGTTYINKIKDSFKWNIGPLPRGPSGSRGTWVASDFWGVYRNTKHPDAAWEFIKYLISTPAVWEMVQLTGQGPMTHTGYQVYGKVYPGIDVKWHLDAAQFAHIQYVGFVPFADRITPIVDRAVTAVWNLQKAPKTAADEAAIQIKNLYAELLKQ